VLSAETFRRDDADADWEAPFRPRDQCARIARHRVFLFCSKARLHGRCAVSSRLAPAARPRYARAMCGRARLSSDVSEIKLVFSIPPHRPTPNIALSWQRGDILVGRLLKTAQNRRSGKFTKSVG
jgi:hypothetical protein